MYLWRYKFDDNKSFLDTQVFPSKKTHFFFKYIIGIHAVKRASAQGMGRHSEEEQTELVINALDNLNVLLGQLLSTVCN